VILALRNKIRRSFERKPIQVVPYMITKRDLIEIGHAQCHSCGLAKKPAWLVNGWATCDGHLADTIRFAADFNRHHGVWLG